jgi:hypothetical protein
VSSQLLLANSGLKVIPALGSSCSLPVDQDQAQGLFRYISCCLGGVLIMASDDCFPFPPCLMPLLHETVTRGWRFHVSGSVPVPVNGSNLEAQVMANPSGVCHASRLCLPLPYLRCQDIFSASSMVSLHVFYLCLPSPPWA